MTSIFRLVLATDRPSHLILGRPLGRQIDETDIILPRKRRGAMRSLTRASIFGILNYCFNKHLLESCYACRTRSSKLLVMDRNGLCHKTEDSWVLLACYHCHCLFSKMSCFDPRQCRPDFKPDHRSRKICKTP